MQNLKLNPSETAEAEQLRRLIDDCYSFETAVKRVAAERGVSEGKARLLVAGSGRHGASLYNEFKKAGN
jgi:hypothetical protein